MEYPGALDDYNSIKKFCSGWFESFSETGDIKVMLHKPNQNTYRGETKDDINRRINIVMNAEAILDSVASSFLNVIKDKLNLSLSKAEAIVNIASVIASIDVCKEIRAEHIAEATRYAVHIDDGNDVTVLESGFVQFAKGDILINPLCRNIDEIQCAINYLSKLL